MTGPADRRAAAVPTGPASQAAPSATELQWLEYFDALAGASHAVLHPADPSDAPVFPMVPPPALPMPAALEERRADVVRLMDRTAHEIERRQADITRELAGLRARPTRSAYHADFGDVLDLVG
jgi:hypothetical protein